MAPSVFSIVSPSPLAGTLLRISALGSIVIAGTKLYLAPRVTSGLADQPLSEVTAPAKVSKLAYYQTAGFAVIGALLQLRWSYTGIASILDKSVFALLALQYTAAGTGFYRLGFKRPAWAFAGGLLPMLAVLFE